MTIVWVSKWTEKSNLPSYLSKNTDHKLSEGEFFMLLILITKLERKTIICSFVFPPFYTDCFRHVLIVSLFLTHVFISSKNKIDRALPKKNKILFNRVFPPFNNYLFLICFMSYLWVLCAYCFHLEHPRPQAIKQ